MAFISVSALGLVQEAAAKIQEIRSTFRDWLDRQPVPVRDRLVAEYNSRFNCYVRPAYDGSAQTFPGLTLEHFPYDSLYPSQKDAVWMIKAERRRHLLA